MLAMVPLSRSLFLETMAAAIMGADRGLRAHPLGAAGLVRCQVPGYACELVAIGSIGSDRQKVTVAVSGTGARCVLSGHNRVV